MADVPIAAVDGLEDAARAAADVIRSGDLRQGEQVAAFEQEFADLMGADFAVAVSSGTAALHLAYLATFRAREQPGYVIVPSMSHISTASMVEFAGGTPVFCDVDPETGCIDVDDARQRLAIDTAAIAPVHLYGHHADIAGVKDLATEEGLSIIWDAAQAHGATFGGDSLGALPGLTTYSFYPTKHVTTGEGGMIVGNGILDDIEADLRRLRSHYQTEKYHHPDLGLNYRMTDIGAAIGRAHLDSLSSRIHARRMTAGELTAAFESVSGIEPLGTDRRGHAYHQYTVRVTDRDRDAVADELGEWGIETAVHYPTPLHEQPAFDTDVTLPTAERLCDEVLSLPVHEWLTGEDVDRVIDAVRAVA